MKVIGIAGGSGAGKSTVSYALIDGGPDTFEVINLDDYQKLKTDPNLPMVEGMINWDHPDIIRWVDLIADIKRLKNGESATIDIWSHRSNPDYAEHGRMIPRTIEPKPVLIVEGYLALHRLELLKLYDKSFYLDVGDAIRSARRDKNDIVTDEGYEAKVLIPMFKQFVEPSKKNADVIIDVSSMGVDEVADKIQEGLK